MGAPVAGIAVEGFDEAEDGGLLVDEDRAERVMGVAAFGAEGGGGV